LGWDVVRKMAKGSGVSRLEWSKKPARARIPFSWKIVGGDDFFSKGDGVFR
jgi:hypothetical protein